VSHDIDDGLRAGLFAAEELFAVPLAGPIFRETAAASRRLELGRLIGEAVRQVITAMVGDLIGETQRRIRARTPLSAADIRAAAEPVASFSDGVRSDLDALKEFLGRRMYRHQRVLDVMANAQHCLMEVFDALMSSPGLLPRDWTDQCGNLGDARTARAVCDYIAGMTDRYLLQEYQRIFHREFPL
jgi:dGTPase